MDGYESSRRFQEEVEARREDTARRLYEAARAGTYTPWDQLTGDQRRPWRRRADDHLDAEDSKVIRRLLDRYEGGPGRRD